MVAGAAATGPARLSVMGGQEVAKKMLFVSSRACCLWAGAGGVEVSFSGDGKAVERDGKIRR